MTALASLALSGGSVKDAAEQSWPPFVLVAGLLLVGLVAERDGLFDAAAARLASVSSSPAGLLAASLLLVAVVTAFLNLDTAAVFLTPVVIKTARARRVPTAPFLYGAVFMANASSLFLPGSNLTNLLVLSGRHASGARFAGDLFAPALAAALLTALGLMFLHRGSLARPHRERRPTDGAMRESRPRPRSGGLAATALAALLIVVLRDAALPVLAVGIAALAWRARRGEMRVGETVRAVGLPSLAGLFVLAVALGTL
ncbi:MAG TPA: SLC13 family permease, partial [Solirubrobacteraceae bacterium]|nr:SLC13 family permease [Solirubrobacteraceae bacterium]